MVFEMTCPTELSVTEKHSRKPSTQTACQLKRVTSRASFTVRRSIDELHGKVRHATFNAQAARSF